jgi:hypothetical protein
MLSWRLRFGAREILREGKPIAATQRFSPTACGEAEKDRIVESILGRMFGSDKGDQLHPR